MTQDDIRKLIARKLLGGYATGSLTEAERALLFEAAVDDQELFDELAREQSLKEILDEPGARERLIAALSKPEPEAVAWWRKPLVWPAVGAVAIGVAIVSWVVHRPPQPSQIALVEPKPATAPVRDEVKESRVDSAPAPKTAPAEHLTKARPAQPGENAKRKVQLMAPPPPPAPAQAKDADKQHDTNQVAQQQVQVQASSPFVNGERSQATQGALGGAGAAPAFRSLSGRIAPRFSLDYSVEDQHLILKFASDGYFSVHFSPGLDTIVDSRVTAGSTRRESIPNNAT